MELTQLVLSVKVRGCRGAAAVCLTRRRFLTIEIEIVDVRGGLNDPMPLGYRGEFDQTFL